jgi:hypothetical protein
MSRTPSVRNRVFHVTLLAPLLLFVGACAAEKEQTGAKAADQPAQAKARAVEVQATQTPVQAGGGRRSID